MNELVGKSHTFPDGHKLEVIQIKTREEHNSSVEVVTFLNHTGPTIPRKQIMKLSEFVTQFGHLFGLKDPPTKPHR